MAKTKHIRNGNKKTRKNINEFKLIPANCPTGLQTFEATNDKIVGFNKHLRGKTNEEIKKIFTKEVTKIFAPNSIKPQNDFYSYVNYLWLQEEHLSKAQQYITQVDDFRLAQDYVYVQLYDIIKEHIKSSDDNMSKRMNTFLKSVLNMNNQRDSKIKAKDAVNMIDDMINEDNVWKMLAFFNRDQMLSTAAPFNCSVAPDNKQSNVFRCNVNPHVFELVDLTVYYDDGKDMEYKRHIRTAYYKCCKEIFDKCLGKNDLVGSDVYDVEVDIFNTLGCTDIVADEKTYNRVYKDDALKKYGFDWNELSKQIGFKTTPPFFIAGSLNYLKCGSDLLMKNWKSKKWRTYWIFIILKKIVRLTSGWENIIYKFYGEIQRGQGALNTDDAVSSALYMSFPFNNFLTKKYVEKFENPLAIQYVKTLCEELKIVFRNTLERNSWLSPKTKKYALYKLSKLTFQIGHMANEYPDPIINYTSSLIENMAKLYEWKNNLMIGLQGQKTIDLPEMDWTQYPVKMVGTQAYIVNASYTPTKNGIFINLGYIQKPFVDLDSRGIEYNLAHVGFTIGHEMSHGFDDWGSQYDADGNLYDWWTDSDKKKFKAIQKDVISQYELFAGRDKIKFDAAIGIGEDMADISAMQICSNYLRNFQVNNQDITIISKLSFQVFYAYFAYQQKQKVSKKAQNAQLKSNPHPPDKYRCNIPLSRSPMFRTIYNVKKSDGMWWHNISSVW
jgi:putative endopeptidase